MIYPSPITLGTASLGMAYGIANSDEVIPVEAANAILDRAWDAGITCFDTAPGYGQAEKRIGDWSLARGASPHVITKLPSLAAVADSDVAARVTAAISSSTSTLGCSSLYGYLTHDASDYLRSAVWDALEAMSNIGHIDAFGPSVYTSEDVEHTLKERPPSILQLPVSALDRRMIVTGALDACHAAGIVVYARSIFLQGVMLMDPAKLPDGLVNMAAPISAFWDIARGVSISPARLALQYVGQLPGINSVVIGVNLAEQLDELVGAATRVELRPETIQAIEELSATIPSELLDPRSWQR